MNCHQYRVTSGNCKDVGFVVPLGMQPATDQMALTERGTLRKVSATVRGLLSLSAQLREKCEEWRSGHAQETQGKPERRCRELSCSEEEESEKPDCWKVLRMEDPEEEEDEELDSEEEAKATEPSVWKNKWMGTGIEQRQTSWRT